MEKEIKTKMVVKYNGHQVKANKSVDLSFKVGYDQLTSTVQVLQLLNNDVDIVAKLPDEPAIKLGSFRVQNVAINHDGESVIKFNSMSDFVETDNFNKLIGSDLIKIQLSAVIELEDEEEE